ncbi:MAG: transcription elongation factor subunit Spt4 [Candidatus Micrarchaeia archaeon]
MPEKACKNCRLIVAEGAKCPNCGGELTDKWSSYIMVFDPAKSELAKKIGAKVPGKYAVRIKM